MGATTEATEIVRLGKEYAELKPVADVASRLAAARAERAELEAMMSGSDPDMADLARDELAALEQRVPEIEHELALLLVPRDADESASAILEVRAGTGGDEAALFAGDLFRMYQRYAQLHGWKVEIDSVSEGEVGGYKEIIASITGEGVFGRLKFESGAHRVQRVPDTEAQGRIHTSAATVAVLPEVEDVEIEINDADLRIDTYRSSGAGGQHVNKTDSAVRMTHIPTGIVVSCQNERSQHKNRAMAMKILRARLFELEQRKKREELEKFSKDKKEIAWGSQIRSYVLHPYQLVKDHRTGVEIGNTGAVLDGAIDEFIEAYLMGVRKGDAASAPE